MNKASENNLIRALDLAVAFATLETFGVVDGRDQGSPRKTDRPVRSAQDRRRYDATHAPAQHPLRTVRSDRQRHVGRPRAATAAGLRHHRSALRRLDRLRYARVDRPSTVTK